MGMADRVVTKAERLEKARQDELEAMAAKLIGDLLKQCKTTHELGRNELTWGAILPAIVPGKEEDLDLVLSSFAANARDIGFTKIEYCKAAAPTEWTATPVRFGSHIHLRVTLNQACAAYFN